MTVKWTEATTEVIDRAYSIIKHFHPELLAEEITIAFVMRSEAQHSQTRTVLAQTSKVPDKFRPYVDYDILIWIAEDEYSEMDDNRRDALIDHELCHIGVTGDGKIYMRSHDFEEFQEIIERRGAWTLALHKAFQYVQLAMPILKSDKPKLEVKALGDAEISIDAESIEVLEEAARILEEQPQ